MGYSKEQELLKLVLQSIGLTNPISLLPELPQTFNVSLVHAKNAPEWEMDSLGFGLFISEEKLYSWTSSQLPLLTASGGV